MAHPEHGALCCSQNSFLPTSLPLCSPKGLLSPAEHVHKWTGHTQHIFCCSKHILSGVADARSGSPLSGQHPDQRIPWALTGWNRTLRSLRLYHCHSAERDAAFRIGLTHSSGMDEKKKWAEGLRLPLPNSKPGLMAPCNCSRLMLQHLRPSSAPDQQAAFLHGSTCTQMHAQR